MNFANTSLFIFVILFSLLASQAGYFLLGYYRVLEQLPVSDFMVVRKSTDEAVRASLKFLYLAALIAGAVVLAANYRQPGSARFILLCLAFTCLLVDVVLAKTVSEPINSVINNQSVEQVAGLPSLQEKWLSGIRIRGAFCLTGFILCISALIFTSDHS